VKQPDKGYPKSFISEHTAEYTLVPNLKNILQKRFNFVTPLFPWATREGSTIARHLHKGESFKVVGLYPRRPKMTSITSSEIIIKLNRQILIGAKRGMELGIPIIAGCPLVKDFWELGNSPNCLWLKLDQVPEDDLDDFELEIEDFHAYHFMNHISKFVFSDKEDLLAYLIERTVLMDFNAAMLSFRDIKSTSGIFHSYFGIVGGYKPVYFLLK